MPPSDAGAGTPRLLIAPGLNDSGPTHWQSRLQARHRDALRVRQRDWATADLDRWAERTAATIERAGTAGVIAVAHSFGCLALVHALARDASLKVHAALLVAPADPDRFGLGERLARARLRGPATLVASDTDPWLGARQARRWAQAWGCHVLNLGDVGHINVASGFGPFPLAERWVDAARQQHARALRPERASLQEWGFAV